jgi:integrase
MDEVRKSQPWGENSEAIYIQNAVAKAPPAYREPLSAFARWLENERGLALETVRKRVGDARSILDRLVGPEGTFEASLTRLDGAGVETLFVDVVLAASPGLRRSLQTTMRSFLRFAAACGWCDDGLADSVPPLYTRRLSSVPRALSSDNTTRLLEETAKPHVPARDRAIVVILATYGVRRGQVALLRLSDIDWRERRITFEPHKGGRRVCHTLTPGVARPLADYIRNERPATDSSRVFLRRLRPYLPIGPQVVTDMVHSRLRRLGIDSGPLGPHGLRHGFATRLLAAGQPMKVIADLLGHRSLSATSIYAKVDHPRLLEVAMEWPGVQP